jgi:hypothetical protein
MKSFVLLVFVMTFGIFVIFALEPGGTMRFLVFRLTAWAATI